MEIRNATIEDLDSLTFIESECFPPKEAATRSQIEKRLKAYSNHFWVVEDKANSKIIGFINGPVINESVISDEMYEHETYHDENGMWQSIFGINTLPDYRRQGIGEMMMNALVEDAKTNGRKGCTLACKDYLIKYYEKFGFVNLGPSESNHGGAQWNNMIIEF